MSNRNLRRESFCLALVLGLGAFGCSVEPSADEGDANEEETSESTDALFSGNVGQAVSATCSTTSVHGLSVQIIHEMGCITPNTLEKLPSRPNLVLGPAVFPYLVPHARDELVKTLEAHPGTTMHINSMFRTVAQQYLLYSWYESGRCGIGLAAHPGMSNHETGLAIDVSETSTWRGSLENHDFNWFGSSDPVHYDFGGASGDRGLDVKAFQRLWNANHPGDKISVDGSYGPQTEARLKKAPASGFAIGSTCG